MPTDTPPSSQLVVADRPARLVLEQRLRPLSPRSWQWITDEQIADDNDRTRARVSQRTIEPGNTGDRRRQLVTFAVTITVPTGDGLRKAEAALDDELDAFLHALSLASIPWDKAAKGRFEDEGNRLGYQVDIRIPTTKRKDA